MCTLRSGLMAGPGLWQVKFRFNEIIKGNGAMVLFWRNSKQTRCL